MLGRWKIEPAESEGAFREMNAFVRMAQSLGADSAYFSRLLDWGTWPKDRFMDQCVWEPGHPLRPEFMQVMRDPLFDDPFVDMGNMTEIRAESLRVRQDERASSKIQSLRT